MISFFCGKCGCAHLKKRDNKKTEHNYEKNNYNPYFKLINFKQSIC